MTEVAELSHQALTPADLLKPPHGLIVFPEIIKSDPRWQQLPPGNIVYINASSPDTVPESVLMLDQDGDPEYTHGHIWERPITEPQRTPAVVIHTGPRTPENSYDEVIAIARTMTTRKTDTDDNGNKKHHQGYVIIVEDKVKGGDKGKEWKRLQLTNLNLVAEDGEELVVETEDHFITFGRVEKEHVTPPHIKARIASEKSEAPPNIEDPAAKAVREKEEKNSALTREYKKNGRLPEEVLPETCGDCTAHLKTVYFVKPYLTKSKVWIGYLKSQTVCNNNSGHRGSGIQRLSKPEDIGSIGRIPDPQLQKH